MGNTVVKDFNGVKLGKGSLPDKLSSEMLIAHDSKLLKRPKTVLVRRDDHRKSTIVFDVASMTPLYITRLKKRKGIRSVTKDRDGRALYLTSQAKRPMLFYRVPQHDMQPLSPEQDPAKYDASPEFLTSMLDDASRHTAYTLDHADNDAASVASGGYISKPRGPMADLPVAAQIEVDKSQAAPVAFFSVIVWGGSGPKKAVPVYKSIRIPQVKFGALVVDMEGQVVGKSFLDEKRMEPIVRIAAGADVASVVEIAAAVIGGF